jgi:hypothetical protein
MMMHPLRLQFENKKLILVSLGRKAVIFLARFAWLTVSEDVRPTLRLGPSRTWDSPGPRKQPPAEATTATIQTVDFMHLRSRPFTLLSGQECRTSVQRKCQS